VIPKRNYGRTGERLSIIGLGGITVAGTAPAHAAKVVDEAIDRGVNYVDVAPTYRNAEELLGPAIRKHRDGIFLACKTTQRRKKEASMELHRSLKRLQTDGFDLYQFHGINSVKEVETIFGPGGAMEAFLEARKQGLINHIGFSAHSVKAALDCLERFDFDSVLFPINFVLFEKEKFGPQVMQRALDKDMACLALKAMAESKWPPGADREAFPKCWYRPTSDPRTAELALRFTLSQPVTAAIPPGDEALFRMAMDFASRFVPITDGELAELREIARTRQPIFQLDG
jgi:aryl-alcohol dehydrogenase-like predicted oxidoreductase